MELNKTSSKNLSTCAEDLALTLETAIESSPFQFEVVKAATSVAAADNLFKRRLSKINPSRFIDTKSKAKTVKYTEELYTKDKSIVCGAKEFKGKFEKSRTVVIASNGIDKGLVLAGHILCVANALKSEGKISSDIICEGLKGGVTGNTEAVSTFSVQ